MSKWILFTDGAADKHAYPVENINGVFLTSNTNITVYVRNVVQPTEAVSDDTITLTCTADHSERELERLLKKLVNKNNNVEVKVSNGITAVAYTAGS